MPKKGDIDTSESTQKHGRAHLLAVFEKRWHNAAKQSPDPFQVVRDFRPANSVSEAGYPLQLQACLLGMITHVQRRNCNQSHQFKLTGTERL